MNVSLTGELEKFIQKQVDTQRYQTASEVVRAALRLMEHEQAFQQAKLEALRHDLKSAEQQLERGEYVALRTDKEKKEFLEGIMRRGREQLASKQRRRSA